MPKTSNVLLTGKYLTTQQYLASTDNSYFARMEADGRFALWLGTPDKPGRVIWASAPPPGPQPGWPTTNEFWVTMQSDGNLCVYRAPVTNCSPYVWSSAPSSQLIGDFHLSLQTDGSLIVFKGTPEHPGQQIWTAPSNPMFVLSALYGVPGAETTDVTRETQAIFDRQHALNNKCEIFELTNISPALFGIPKPAPGQKTFTIVYSLTAPGAGSVFMRGAQDGNTLKLIAHSSRYISVTKAVYAGNSGGVDVTEALNNYFRDPANGPELTIGSPRFMDALLEGGAYDPAPKNKKYFSATYITSPGSTTVKRVCGCDTQTVSLS